MAKYSITPLYVVMFALLLIVGLLAQPMWATIYSAARVEKAARLSTMVNGLLKRGISVVWMLWGLSLALATGVSLGALPSIIPEEVPTNHGVTLVMGQVTEWGKGMQGARGLLIIWVCAGAVTGAAMALLAAGGVLTTHLACARRSPGSHCEGNVRLARWVCLAVALIGVGLSLGPHSLRAIIEAMVGLPAVVGLSGWLALYWRRYNTTAFIVATAVGYCTWVALESQAGAHLVQICFPSIVTIIKGKPEVDDGWLMLFFLGSTLIAGVMTALLTTPEARERFDRFQELLRTPVDAVEPPGEPCCLPAGVQPGTPPMLIDRGNWQIPRPRKSTMIGFAVCCALSGALIVGTWLLLAGLRSVIPPG